MLRLYAGPKIANRQHYFRAFINLVSGNLDDDLLSAFSILAGVLHQVFDNLNQLVAHAANLKGALAKAPLNLDATFCCNRLH